MRMLSHLRELSEALKDWGRYQSISLEELHTDSDLAGFRNVLVHVYWGLDLEEVYAILQNDLKVLEEFKKVVKELLEEL